MFSIFLIFKKYFTVKEVKRNIKMEFIFFISDINFVDWCINADFGFNNEFETLLAMHI